MLWIIAICLSACFGSTFQVSICAPIISEGSTGNMELNGYIFFECKISTCDNLNTIVFEKTGLNESWTPLFEGINKTQYKALNTTTEYTLESRYVYYPFPTKHTLNIDPLILDDTGKWRCVVYDVKSGKYTSDLLDLRIYVLPVEGAFFIKPNRSDLVTNQQQEFTCVVRGVYPEPQMFWEVNGVKDNGLLSMRQHENKLWFVNNTIQIRFDTVGVKTVNCVIRAVGRDPWFEKHINISVQEPAIVLYPQHDMFVTLDVDATFSLGCTGSGYRSRIIWNRNDEIIYVNNTKYNIMQQCDYSKCYSSISSILMDPVVACTKENQYTGAYTCVVTLELPYQSSQISSNMNVTLSKRHCKGENIGQIVGFSILLFVCLILVAVGVGFLVYRKKLKILTDNSGEPLLPREEELDCITPSYSTEHWLKLCGQSRSYNSIVLFGYGSNRVFIHSISKLNQHTAHFCDMKIYMILRIQDDRFVVTEFGKHNIHLLQLEGEKLKTLNTMEQNEGYSRTLVCAENDSSFIKCEFSGEDLQQNFVIYRVNITNDTLTPNCLTPEHVTLTGEPWRVSLVGMSNVLVIVTVSGKIFTGNLDDYSAAIADDTLAEFIVGGVRSLYIDIHGNIFLGSRGGHIHMYTPDKNLSVMRVGEPVRGLTVIDNRLIVCCGQAKKQQHINVYSSEKLNTI